MASGPVVLHLGKSRYKARGLFTARRANMARTARPNIPDEYLRVPTGRPETDWRKQNVNSTPSDFVKNITKPPLVSSKMGFHGWLKTERGFANRVRGCYRFTRAAAATPTSTYVLRQPRTLHPPSSGLPNAGFLRRSVIAGVGRRSGGRRQDGATFQAPGPLPPGRTRLTEPWLHTPLSLPRRGCGMKGGNGQTRMGRRTKG